MSHSPTYYGETTLGLQTGLSLECSLHTQRERETRNLLLSFLSFGSLIRPRSMRSLALFGLLLCAGFFLVV